MEETINTVIPPEVKTQKERPANNKASEIWATGRRKTSVARLKMVKGTGVITINRKTLDKYFGGNLIKNEIYVPLKMIPESSKYDFIINVSGGGTTGQAEAIRHAFARALSSLSDVFRKKLKDAGFLRRDPRMVERKKPGQPKARKKFQWTKR